MRNRRIGVDFWYDDPLQELSDEPQLCPDDTEETVTRVYDPPWGSIPSLERSEEHTSELQSQSNLVCRLLLEKKKQTYTSRHTVRTRRGAQAAERCAAAQT